MQPFTTRQKITRQRIAEFHSNDRDVLRQIKPLLAVRSGAACHAVNLLRYAEIPYYLVDYLPAVVQNCSASGKDRVVAPLCLRLLCSCCFGGEDEEGLLGRSFAGRRFSLPGRVWRTGRGLRQPDVTSSSLASLTNSAASLKFRARGGSLRMLNFFFIAILRYSAQL